MLKRVLITLTAVLSVLYAQAQSADITFAKTTHDFGKVKEGTDTLWVYFDFKNTGDSPLVIADVKTSCDCTLAEWPKGPIAPGASAKIRGGYKIAGKPVGVFMKNIIIMANTMPATTVLTLKGEIIGD